MSRNRLLNTIIVLPVVALACIAGDDGAGRSQLRAETSQNATLHAEMLADAELHDVFFLDPDRGWAVGERGAIWTTDDGGRSWRAQESPQACRWESVWFVDAKNGWVVGGWHHPGTFQSRGAVLRTRDGGLNWMPVPVSTLPLLHKVQFRDDLHGWAIGEPTGMYPSGVFQSDDGGRSWQPVHSTTGGPWLAGDFVGARAALAQLQVSPTAGVAPGKLARRVARQGIVAGRYGRVALITDEGLIDTTVEATRGRHVRTVLFDPEQGAWLAGDDGLLLHSRDGGLNWTPTQEPPAAVGNAHWRSIAVHGNHTWIVGDPGSHVLHSADGGASWELQLTGQPLPLHAVWFLDAHHGWAAGALGTLLSTRDGGRTWKRQHGSGRAAVLGVFAHESAIPLEMIAQVAGNDGYLSVVELPYRRDVESTDSDYGSLESRVQAAVLTVGGSATHMASEFPVRQHGLRLPQEQWISGWNQVHGGRGVERLTEYLVERLRVWRPDVIVTEDAARDPHDSLAPLTRQLVLLAVQRAADPQAYPEQIGQAGLNPWRVKRVLSYMGPAEKGTIQLPTTQLAPRWSRPLGDIASSARLLLERQPSAAHPTLAFRILFDEQPHGATRRDLLAGVAIPSGGDGRRAVSDSPRGELTDLTRLVQRQRTLQQLMLRSSESGGGANPAWLAQLDDAIQGFGKQTAGEVYWQLGHRFYEAGQTQIALETWQHLASRLPHHDLSDAALLRLVELHNSAEVRWRREKAARAAAAANASAAAIPFTSVRPVAAELPLEETMNSSTTGPRRGAPAVVKPAALAVESTTHSGGSGQAERFGKLLEQSRPALFAESRVRTSWLSALRAADRTSDADALLRTAARPQSDDSWQQTLAHEAWLAVPANRKLSIESSPRPAVKAPLVAARPHLDGQLDESLWSSAATLELRSELQDDADWPATVRVTRDREFLYLAAVCKKAPGRPYEQPTIPRPRDADLAGFDRVEFHVDVDRDGATAWKLTCDERGWTFESCAGDAHWNPTWYVAARQDEQAWTVEAAIPFEELAPATPADGAVWSLGVQRIVPGRGFQSWSRPAAASVAQPAGFGWLRFE